MLTRLLDFICYLVFPHEDENVIDHDDTGIEIQPNGLFLVIVNGKAVRRNMTFMAAMDLLDAYENVQACAAAPDAHAPWLTSWAAFSKWN